MIERRIIIGLITSTEFIQRISDKWNIQLLESTAAKRLATWCMEYYNKYNKAPNREIETIYFKKLKSNLPKDVAQEIEEDILPDLSEQYEDEGINVDYLVDEAIEYFNKRHLTEHGEQIQALIEAGKTLDAERLASSYAPIAKDSGSWIDLADKSVLDKVKQAFNRSLEVLIKFSGALGEFINDQLVRGAFVAFMGKSKMGKSFIALELALKGCRQKRKVAFFQAGDMSESEQLMRLSIRLTGKSNNKKYCGKMYEPVKDCVFNQNDECNKDERQCDYGLFPNKTPKELRNEIELKDLIAALKENPDYEPCSNCEEYKSNKWGCSFVKPIEVKQPLQFDDACKAFEQHFIKFKRSFKLSTHINNSLSVKQIKSILDIWERQENFVPDIIIIDYADLMIDEYIKEERPKQNQIWKDLRGLSQERHCLVITFTQSDADSYSKDTLKMGNFSEDKRKFDHVTAMFGLNEDSRGREKDLGIMRINDLVKREGDFSSTHQVRVLKNLKRGKPILTSFW